ncbi:MAG TPA: right-handed parallel beta-helix repeat-containing protein, partial [Alphaproteobacteria bacterium]|nr:right-handed parallel beta-helix repeat-containing protein [Alphaproteobacteria bacterium]
MDVVHRRSAFVFMACVLSLAPIAALGQGKVDGVAPGAIAAEPATPTALGVRWPVVGDRNLNAAIAVAYRKVGEQTWAEGYPLFRTFNDRVSPDNVVQDGHLFAGSIVDLAPDTEYEVRLSLEDPDGGSIARTLKMRTAAIPRLPANLQRRHVVPLAAGQAPGGSGTESDPYRGLRAALQRAQPGDLLLLASGTYADGPYALAASGTPDRPIVLQGRADGSAVLDGRGGEILLDASGRAHWWFDRLGFRNAGTLLKADRASHIRVTRNRFDFTKLAFSARTAIYRESVGIYVTDNVFVGSTRWPRTRETGIEEIYAVTVTGSGHVVAYNLIQNAGDGVHNGDVGRLSASDIYNNDIESCTDDGIEVDYSDTNVRVFRNRITNTLSGISFQPIHGGPVYAFRNMMLNQQYSPFKLHNDMAGALIFHNTSIKSGIPFNISIQGETVRDVMTRNNLFVGTGGPALSSTGKMARTDFDSDGFEWPPRGAFARWNGRDYPSTTAARGSNALYSKIGAYTMGPHRTFATLAPPQTHERAISRTAHDPRLGPSSRAIDRGARLPNLSLKFG